MVGEVRHFGGRGIPREHTRDDKNQPEEMTRTLGQGQVNVNYSLSKPQLPCIQTGLAQDACMHWIALWHSGRVWRVLGQPRLYS